MPEPIANDMNSWRAWQLSNRSSTSTNLRKALPRSCCVAPSDMPEQTMAGMAPSACPGPSPRQILCRRVSRDSCYLRTSDGEQPIVQRHGSECRATTVQHCTPCADIFFSSAIRMCCMSRAFRMSPSAETQRTCRSSFAHISIATTVAVAAAFSTPADLGDRTGDFTGDSAAAAPVTDDGDAMDTSGAVCGDMGGVAVKLLHGAGRMRVATLAVCNRGNATAPSHQHKYSLDER
jgi:hypothetical protein